MVEKEGSKLMEESEQKSHRWQGSGGHLGLAGIPVWLDCGAAVGEKGKQMLIWDHALEGEMPGRGVYN